MELAELEKFIREVPDFPKPGIRFRDITPLLQDKDAWNEVVVRMAEQIAPLNPSKLVGIESRGFIFASALSVHLKSGLVLIRKKGKLPWKVEQQDYSLEYGVDQIEIHQDALDHTDRVIIVDDVLATGGTARAASLLCQKLGATVAGFQVLVELKSLKGREQLNAIPFFSIFNF